MINHFFFHNWKKIIPIRCFTCNGILGDLSNEINDIGQSNLNPDFFHKHGITRYCCQKILCTFVDIYKNSFHQRDQSFYTLKKNTEVENIFSTK